jgi:excisionase family DNA binding protein
MVNDGEESLNKISMDHIEHQVMLLRIDAFCQALEIKEATARKWVQERRIASVKVGSRAVRIPRSEANH